jgi:hypothetical protein
MSSGEFEDREGNHPSMGAYLPPLAPHDIARGQAIANQRANTILPPGRLPHVASTFDARPINAQDFCAVQYDLVSTFINYTVPSGYIGILRSFQFDISPIVVPLAFPFNPVTIAVGGPSSAGVPTVINGVAQQGYINMELGCAMSYPQECYILAAGGQTISLNLMGLTLGGFAISFSYRLTGTLLIDDGRPLNYIPGNID